MTTTNIFSICLAVSLFGAGCSKDLENSEPPAVEVNKIGSEFAVGTQNERLLENFSRNPFVHREIPYVAMAGAQSLGSAIRIRPSAVVAVKDHGARPSDGNDDTPAFYSALAKARELVAGGSRVTIQMDSGIYQLSDALFV